MGDRKRTEKKNTDQARRTENIEESIGQRVALRWVMKVGGTQSVDGVACSTCGVSGANTCLGCVFSVTLRVHSVGAVFCIHLLMKSHISKPEIALCGNCIGTNLLFKTSVMEQH